MTKTITATFSRPTLNPYATKANGRPEYIVYFTLAQPQPDGAAMPGAMVGPAMGAVEVGVEMTAAEYAELSPGCTVALNFGTVTAASLPA